MDTAIIRLALTVSITIYLCFSTSCSSENKDPEIPTQEFQYFDSFDKDTKTASVSKEDFEANVLNKLWYYPSGKDSESFNSWLDMDGNSYSYAEYCPSGRRSGSNAYCFNSDKFEDFYMEDYFLHPDHVYVRRFMDYEYNPETGCVYTEEGNAYLGLDKVLFYIESVSDTELIIHDQYINHPGFESTVSGQFNLCSRRVLKVATEKEAKEWREKYTL